MNKYKLRRKTITIIAIIVVICSFLGAMLKLLLWNSSYEVTQVKVSSSFVSKVISSEKNGSILQLNKDELNEAISIYFKKGKNLKGIEIKGISGDIKDNKIIFYIPINYKGVNLLTSSEGELTYSKDRIEYKPLYFKVGKIPLYNTFVMNQIKGYVKDGVSIENNIIAISKNIIPLQIKDIELKENKVFLELKESSNVQDKLKNAGISEDKKVMETTDEKGALTENNLPTSGKETVENPNQGSTEAKQSVTQRNEALDRIAGGLNSAMSSVTTDNQKAVISVMISKIEDMKGNPNADPYSAAGSVKAVYRKLSSQEKLELKSAVFSNINGSDVNMVSSMMEK